MDKLSSGIFSYFLSRKYTVTFHTNCLLVSFDRNFALDSDAAANYEYLINSFPASGDFCHLLITVAKSLDPDQARQNVGPDLDPNFLTLMVFLKDFFEKVNFKRKIHRQ